MQTLGEWIRAKRKAKGFSQEDLAKAADLSLGTIRKAEAGKTELELRTRRLLADALEVPFAEIYAVSSPAPPPAGKVTVTVTFESDVFEDVKSAAKLSGHPVEAWVAMAAFVVSVINTRYGGLDNPEAREFISSLVQPPVSVLKANPAPPAQPKVDSKHAYRPRKAAKRPAG